MKPLKQPINLPLQQPEIITVDEILGKRQETISHKLTSNAILKVDEAVLEKVPSRS